VVLITTKSLIYRIRFTFVHLLTVPRIVNETLLSTFEGSLSLVLSIPSQCSARPKLIRPDQIWWIQRGSSDPGGPRVPRVGIPADAWPRHAHLPRKSPIEPLGPRVIRRPEIAAKCAGSIDAFTSEQRSHRENPLSTMRSIDRVGGRRSWQMRSAMTNRQ
jgi:hypothetical protein